jgi:hypothetical protein
MKDAKLELQNELQTASDYIVELEEKFFNSQRTSLILLKELKENEKRNEEIIKHVESNQN